MLVENMQAPNVPAPNALKVTICQTTPTNGPTSSMDGGWLLQARIVPSDRIVPLLHCMEANTPTLVCGLHPAPLVE